MVKNKDILAFGSTGFLENHLVKSLYADNEVTQFDIQYPQNELIEFCSKLSIKHIVPNHYDMFVNNTRSIDLFKKEMRMRNPKQSIITLNYGDKVSNIRGYHS